METFIFTMLSIIPAVSIILAINHFKWLIKSNKRHMHYITDKEYTEARTRGSVRLSTKRAKVLSDYYNIEKNISFSRH